MVNHGKSSSPDLIPVNRSKDDFHVIYKFFQFKNSFGEEMNHEERGRWR